MKKQKLSIVKECYVAMGIVINIVGSFIALNLHLPVYLDSIGTIMVGALLGPGYAVATGLLGSLVNGFTFDIYSLYFAPVQIIIGLMAGLLYKSKWMKGGRTLLGAFFLSLPGSIVSAIVCTFVFGGITSSGSSFLVQIMTKAGLNLTVSCFIVQVITDYFDKLIAVLIIAAVLAAAGNYLKQLIKD